MLTDVLLDEAEGEPRIVVSAQDEQPYDVFPLSGDLPRLHRQEVELHVVLGGMIDVVAVHVFAGADIDVTLVEVRSEKLLRSRLELLGAARDVTNMGYL
jgi:hypothetical protein